MSNQSLQQLLATNFNLLPSGYTGSIGFTGSAGANAANVPKITNIQVTNSSYTVLDDTAVDIAGGFIRITGTGFETGCQVLINNIPASSTTFISSTEVRAQVPATAAGTYIVYVVNTDGGVAIRINGITFSTTPTWSTASALGNTVSDALISIQLSAAGATTYSLQAGSTLPAGLTLSSSGLLSGTVTGLSSETTFSFTILATDAELQDSPRTFSITITANDPNFRNTSLLLSADTPGATFVTDASTNAVNVSVVGDTRPNTFGPYTPGYYSNFFDGTGDFLRVPSTGAGFSSITTFTYECWIQPTSALGTNCIFDISESQPFRFVLSGSNVTWQASSSGSTILTATFTWVIGAWYHVAFVRDSSNNISIFINGTRYATANFGGNWGATAAGGVNIGCNRGDTWFFPGYISNARFVKGTAVYDPTQTTITVPTTPLTAVSGTSLLTCQSNRFIDNSADNLTVTRNGDVRIDGFDPFVPAAETASLGSAYFDGTGDFLTTTMPALGTGSFTVEFWFYPTDPTRAYLILDKAFRDGNFSLQTDYLNTGAFYLSVAGSSYTFSFTPPIVNQWNHVAISRDGSSLRFFLNGVQLGTTQTNSSSVTTGTLYIGGASTTGSGYLTTMGYISNLRMTTTAVYTANFTPSTIPLTAITNTSLLTLQTNQPTNNNMFVDRSTNNLLITRAGNTTPGSFSPYAGGWSNFFDGNGDYLSVAYNVALNILSGNFTVECWINHTSTQYDVIVSSWGQSGVNSTDGWIIYVGANNELAVDWAAFSTNASMIVTANNVIQTGRWHHVALTRSGNNFTLWVDGVSVGTATNSGSNSSQYRIDIGFYGNGTLGASGQSFFNGYISNLRIIKGTAVYTSSFTPPTQPLVPIAGTALLTCADNRLVDDSPNNFAITRNGDVSVQKFSPFGMQTQIVPNSHSVFFDGTGDYINIASNAAFGYGTGDFTIEFWAYFTSISASTPNLIDQRAGASVQVVPTLYLNNGVLTYYVNGNNRWSGSTLVANTWYHIALSRSSGTTRIFLNGVQNGSSYADPNNYIASPVRIFASNDGGTIVAQSGYCSNLRIVNGTALYTANFTPSTTPLTAIANTSLLACQSPTLVDNSTNAFALAAVGDSRPMPVNPFGYTNPTNTAYTTTASGGSMYFDGTGDVLTISSNEVLAFGTGNFTVEMWYYPTAALSSSNICLYNTGSNNFFIQIRNNAFGIGQVGITENNTFSFNFVANQWYHLAVARSGSTVQGFVNGALVGSSSNSVNYGQSGATVGGLNSSAQLVTGYISDLRIVRGQAVYAGAFVPPAAPLDAVRNTTLLLRGTAAGVYDITMNNNLETVGDARINNSITRFTGRSSIFFDGTGDSLFIPSSRPLTLVGDFTVEAWTYLTATNAEYPIVFSSGVFFIRYGNSGFGWKLQIAINDTGVTTVYSTANTQSSLANQWVHMAFTRSSGTNRFFVNGVLQSLNTGANPSTYPLSSFSDSTTVGGSTWSIGSAWNGYISDFRVTNGVARYTANFTAPTNPLIPR